MPKLSSFAKDQVSVLNTFHAASALLNRETREKLNFRQKMDMFFLDSDLIPLIIFDSYLTSMKKVTSQSEKSNKPKETSIKDLQLIA